VSGGSGIRSEPAFAVSGCVVETDGAEDTGADEGRNLFVRVATPKLSDTATMSTRSGDVSFFLGVTVDFGLPQCGQFGALGEMSLPQSGQLTRGIV